MSEEIPKERLAEQTKVRNLLPKRDDFKGKPGYSETPGKVWRTGVGWVDGYTWKYEHKPNEQGKRTRETEMVMEAMRPFQKADVERVAKFQAEIPRARLVDAEGRTNFITADQAESVARRNGWRAPWKPDGLHTEAGPEGMIFRWIDGWQPTGRWCLGTPFDHSTVPPFGRRDGSMKKNFVLLDPSGGAWKWSDGEWRML